MFKKFSVILVILSILLTMACSNQTQSNYYELKSLFQKWDEGKIGEYEKINIIHDLYDFLSKNPKFSSEEIKALSPFISVFQIDSLRIIEYIENPEYYGSSGRESFHLTLVNGKTNMLNNRGSMRIVEIRKTGEHLYTLFATDYKVSNVTGIKILKLEVDDDDVRKSSLIKQEHLLENFYYDVTSEVLYYNNGHIFFKEISDNGDTVVISIENSEYIMSLVQNEYYQLLK